MEEQTQRISETHIPRIKLRPLRELQEGYVPDITATVESEYFASDDCLLEFLNLPPHLLTKHVEGITLKDVSNEHHLNSDSQPYLAVDSQQFMLANSMQLTVSNKKGTVCGILERVLNNSPEGTVWTSNENSSESETRFFLTSEFVETETLNVDSNPLTTEQNNFENHADINFDRFCSDNRTNVNDQANVECFKDTEVIDLPMEKETVDMTDLKNGIIEASRTLINTQKMLKTLSQVALKREVLKHHQILNALSKFKILLKLFQGSICRIEKSVSNQYKDLFPKCDIDSLLESIKKSMPEKSTKHKVKKRKKKDPIGTFTGECTEKSKRRRRKLTNPEH